jgi:hypothetical protein
VEADRHDASIRFLLKKLSERRPRRNDRAVHRRPTITALAAAAGLLLAAAAFALTARGAAETGRLVATVGPDFTIRLDDADGKTVSSLRARHYSLLVRDLSAEHNFVMADKPAGLKLRIDSGVEFVGEKTFEIDLEAGRYAFACSPHFQVMNGEFTVFPAATTTPKPKPPPTRAAGVTVAGRAYAPRSLKAGRYRLVVSDRSPTRNFRLEGPGVKRATGKAFTGTVRWTLRLNRATYRFGSDPGPLPGRLRVQ